MPPALGEVWRWADFYNDRQTGEPLTKYVAVLAFTQGGDIVARLLTSQESLRSRAGCSHDPIRPGYYLGVLDPNGRLHEQSWVDLRELEDVDPRDWDGLVRAGKLAHELNLTPAVLCEVLQCAIGAPDTTRQQQVAMYASRTQLQCR
jgi:hypothetical protein